MRALCKADPGGLPPGGGRGRGVSRAASDNTVLSDGEAARPVTGRALAWPGAGLAQRSELPGEFFYGAKRSEKKHDTPRPKLTPEAKPHPCAEGARPDERKAGSMSRTSLGGRGSLKQKRPTIRAPGRALPNYPNARVCGSGSGYRPKPHHRFFISQPRVFRQGICVTGVWSKSRP